MKLEDQVVSLELARELKKIGIKQDSHFYWYYTVYTHEDFGWKIVNHSCFGSAPKNYIEYNSDKIISAFTIAELGQLLPECIPNEGDLMMWNCMHDDVREWGIEYCGSGIEHFTAIKEADARAMMLLELIKLGYSKLINGNRGMDTDTRGQ